MSVPMLKGWWDQIKEPTEKIADALDNRFNYQKKLQLSMQQEIAKNPQLIQQFADLRARDPQILNKMGLSGIDAIISGVPESSTSIADKRKAGNLSSPRTSQESGQERANDLGIRDPLQQRSLELGIAGAEQGLETGEQNLQLGKYNLALKKAFAPLFERQATVEGFNLDSALRTFGEEAKGIEALDVLKGDYSNKDKLSPEQLNLLSSNPRFKEEWNRMQQDYWRKDAKEWQVRFSASERRGNLLYSAMLKNAEELSDIGGVPFQAAMQFEMLPTDTQRQLMLASAPPADPNEAMLWQAGQAQKTIAARKGESHFNNTVKMFYNDPTFVTNMKALTAKGKTTKQKQEAVSVANGILAAKANTLGMANPPQIEVKEIDHTWPRSNEIQYIITGGNLALGQAIAREAGIEAITPSEAIEKDQASKVMSDPAKLDALAQTVFNDLSSLATQKEKDEALTRWAQGKDANIVIEVRKRLSKFGAKP